MKKCGPPKTSLIYQSLSRKSIKMHKDPKATLTHLDYHPETVPKPEKLRNILSNQEKLSKTTHTDTSQPLKTPETQTKRENETKNESNSEDTNCASWSPLGDIPASSNIMAPSVVQTKDRFFFFFVGEGSW